MDFKQKQILGMIHLSGGHLMTERALKEIEIYTEEGLQGCIVENYHGSADDVKKVLYALSLKNTKIEIGINILPNEYEEAFEIANQFDSTFIQLDFVSGTYKISREFDVDHYLSIRNKYPNIKVLGGVWPKYYEPITGSVLKDDVEDGIKRCDAIVVTGSGTGKETPLDKIIEFRKLCGDHPLIIGAGLDSTNVGSQLKYADGAIVGSCFKPHKMTTEMVDRYLVREFMREVIL